LRPPPKKNFDGSPLRTCTTVGVVCGTRQQLKVDINLWVGYPKLNGVYSTILNKKKRLRVHSGCQRPFVSIVPTTNWNHTINNSKLETFGNHTSLEAIKFFKTAISCALVKMYAS